MKRIPALLLLAAIGLASASMAAAQTDTVRLVFIGDVMSHGPQVTAALRPGGNPADKSDYDYSSYFQYVRPWFREADLVVANMEFPVGVRPYSGYPFFSAPPALPEEARRSCVSVFLTANNHLCDRGRTGLDSTYIQYSLLGVPFTGFYRSEGEEYENDPLILNVRGHHIALANFTYGTNGLPVPQPYRINQLDSTHIREVLRRGRARGAEFIIALPHWGEEYQLTPNASQRSWADLFFREGADAIVGAHTHVVQPVESMPDGRPVAWSLGNFISNQPFPYSQIGMLLSLTLVCDAEGIRVAEVRPTYLWCSRHGMYEKNYTVFPITDWIGTRDRWIDPSEYDKMIREWEAVKRKFNL
ncbi:MAG: CapA family protein [Bacteroidales bacterium]|nr:CapA family protein [Bacteroidales bacterium]